MNGWESGIIYPSLEQFAGITTFVAPIKGLFDHLVNWLNKEAQTPYACFDIVFHGHSYAVGSAGIFFSTHK